MTALKINRPGYKKTAAGCIPNDWECVRLGSVFTNRKQKGKKGLPVLSVTMDRGVILRSEIDRKMGDDLPPDQSLLVEPGDIAYNMMRMWQGAVGVCPQSGVISPAYVVCRPVKARADADYMYFLFKSHIGRHLLTSYSYGIHEDRLRLYYDGFALVPIPLPPLHEQKHIVEILATWDTAIEQTRALICAKNYRKDALRQLLLTGEIRLAGYTDIWKKKPLTDICAIRFSSVDKKSVAGETLVRLCNYTDVYYNDIITVKQKFMSATATSNEIEQFSLYKDDILLTKDSESPEDIAKCAVVMEDLPGVLCGYHLALLRPLDDVNGLFLAQSINSQDVRMAFTRYANGVTRFGLPITAFEQIEVCLPSLSEQRAIAAVLSTADDEIRALEDEVKALECQKKGLMQKLLTGEIRIAQTN